MFARLALLNGSQALDRDQDTSGMEIIVKDAALMQEVETNALMQEFET